MFLYLSFVLYARVFLKALTADNRYTNVQQCIDTERSEKQFIIREECSLVEKAFYLFNLFFSFSFWDTIFKCSLRLALKSVVPQPPKCRVYRHIPSCIAETLQNMFYVVLRKFLTQTKKPRCSWLNVSEVPDTSTVNIFAKTIARYAAEKHVSHCVQPSPLCHALKITTTYLY